MPFNTRTHCSESIATQYAPHIARLSILARINKQTTTSSALVSAGRLASGADVYSSVRNQTGEELSEGGGSRGEKGIIFHSDLFSQLVLKVALLFCHRPVFCAPVVLLQKQALSIHFCFPTCCFAWEQQKGNSSTSVVPLDKENKSSLESCPEATKMSGEVLPNNPPPKKIETFF